MTDSPEKLAGLVRSLNLIPYLHSHPGATPMEIARDLGYSHEEVMADLTRLTLSGVGSGPGELIDLVASWTGITLIDDQGLNKPLRLTPTEANALLLTLESLENMPGLVDPAAVASAAAKIRAVSRGRGVDGDFDADAQAWPVAATVAEAIRQSRQLELDYYSASSDSTSVRTVSPASLFHRDGQTYLRAFEPGAAEPKSFRLDRIRAARLTPDEADIPAGAPGFDGSDPFGFSDRARARLLVRREATWLAEYWEIDLAEVKGEWVEATMPYGSADWLVRFCLAQADRVRLTSPAGLAGEVRRRASAGLAGLR
ncbi:helix-turn-helix transcriptional regulator [Corynebacterium liangguodongii]|uniref:WYL domain-containing protein n=1 Tax=Corynebacterium liangguodongii TaxID=2079535 RepID=A0A2S0WE24_9CORY|nr:WYL domain-containing protein [Corynebacterium liangguodongii]AWB84000.1 WYL domain-containing protein [Corynebacterium liangguodongii]PWC00012.1 WYL domain-containing protein [Corynebacterium liangguodongii]